MKAALRSLKNEWNDYTEGERLIREMSSNNDDPPRVAELQRIVYLINQPANYQRMYMMLMRRVTDFRYLRHMEKGLIVVEYLMKYAEHRFVRSCKVNLKHFEKLRGYRYDLYGRDYGGNVRRRAKRIVEYLRNDAKLEDARAKAQGPSYKRRVARKKPQSKRTSSQKKSSRRDENIKPSTAKKQAIRKKSDKKKRDKKKKVLEQKAPEEDLLGDFASVPASSGSNGHSKQDSDLLTDAEWFQEFVVDDAAQAGQGDDGGKFTFGAVDDDAFDDDDFFGDEGEAKDMDGDGIPDEPANADAWISKLTKMDNPLEVVEKPREKKKSTGKTMAQLASKTSGSQGSSVPQSFDTDFEAAMNLSMGNPVPAKSSQKPGASGPMSQSVVVRPPPGGAGPGHFGKQPSTTAFQPVADPWAQYTQSGTGTGVGAGGQWGAGPADPFASLVQPKKSAAAAAAVPPSSGGYVGATYKKPVNHDPFSDLGLGNM